MVNPMPDRRTVPPYKCLYTWDVHYACNYRCSYCFFNSSWEEEKKKNRYPGIARWKNIWDAVYERYGGGLIHVSGGEPFTYPDFIDLLVHLRKKFDTEHDTNLSFDLKEFMEKVAPERVKLNATFHPQFADIETFFDKALTLKKAGFALGVNYVAFPEQLGRMAEYKKRFNDAKISFDIMPFRGTYQGREYPQGYDESEKKILCEAAPKTAPPMFAAYDQKKSPAPSNPHAGKLCRMGQMYTKIQPDGTAYRCCKAEPAGKLGNLIDGTFSFYEHPQPCGYTGCSCWRAMIVDQEQNWLRCWLSPKEIERGKPGQ